MIITIEIAKTCSDWMRRRQINKRLMKKLTNLVLSKFNNLMKITEIELSILLTEDQDMLNLNNEFRGSGKVTNVLSFPDIELNWRTILEFTPESDYMYLGDIAFGYQIIQQEAMDSDKTFEQHFTHLFIHSILHLLGFDHKNEEDASAMESFEIDILRSLSISSPY
jgi:probable rRNA maturation factor